MQRLILLPLLFLTSLGIGHAQAEQQIAHTLDSILNSEFKSGEPGISVLIAPKGRIIYKKAFGSASLELNTPLGPDMVFKIGSVTKQFTAIGVLQLVEQGKISLQDSIQKYIKEFPSKGSTITIEHLLTHTSGIKEYTTIEHTDPYIERHDFTPQLIIDHFKNAPLDFKPGTKYAYSNSGYVLLGFLIEKVTGKSYHEYMTENVIKRAGLTNTIYGDETMIIPGRVSGYTRDRGFYENTHLQTISMGYAAGDLLSTTEDLYKWNNAVFAYKLVKKEVLDKAFTPFILTNGQSAGYGYGWYINPSHGHKCIHHEGQVSGFIAGEDYFPELDTYVCFLTNVKSGEDKTDFSDRRFRLFDKIVGIAVGEKEAMPDQSILDSYTGVYQMVSDPRRTMEITKEKNYLVLKISKQNTAQLVFQSTQKFELAGIPGIAGEFVHENGKVTKMVISQNGVFEWKKIK